MNYSVLLVDACGEECECACLSFIFSVCGGGGGMSVCVSSFFLMFMPVGKGGVCVHVRMHT